MQNLLLIRGLLISILLLSMSLQSKAQASISLQQQAESYFKDKVSAINASLQENQIEFNQSPSKLVQFVDAHLLAIWESEKTLRGLLGRVNWESLPVIEKENVKTTFNDTMQRYVQESFKHYDGQVIEFVEIQLNETGSRGLLTVRVIPNLLPSFNIHLKVIQEKHEWKFYDAMIQGASYVSLKKDSYRKLFNNKGIKGFLGTLNEKNYGFLPSSLNKKTASYN